MRRDHVLACLAALLAALFLAILAFAAWQEVEHPCTRYVPDTCTGFHQMYCGDGCFFLIPYEYSCSRCTERAP